MTQDTDDNDIDELTANENALATFDNCVDTRTHIRLIQNSIQEFMEEQRDTVETALKQWESIPVEELDDPLREQVERTQEDLREMYQQLGGQQ
jgi:hypothetical protein